MSRPSDWSPLAASDPVPGDPYQVMLLGKKLREVADAIEEQSNKLKALCTDGYWDSDAGKNFDETAQKTSTSLHKAYGRYDVAAQAIQTYQPVLDAQQDTSLTLLTQAQQLEREKNAAQARLDGDEAAAKNAPPPPPDAPPTPERPGAAGDRSTVGDYASALKALQDKADECARLVREAARTAAHNINDKIDDDGLEDHWWNSVQAFIHQFADFLKKLSNIMGWIATICGVLALLVGWIPVIGQVLAAVLTAVALVATAISLICHLALLISGDGGLLDVVLDVVGLLTFGVGAAATRGIRGGITAVKASGKLSRAATAITGQITARGGNASRAVVNALSKGDLTLASQLSRVPKSSLKGMMGGRYGSLVADFGTDGTKALTKTLASAPGGFFPRGVDFAAGFKSGYKEVFTDVGKAFRGQLPDVGADVKAVRSLVNGIDTSSMSTALKVLDLQVKFNFASIATGVTIDGIDKMHGWDFGKGFGSTWGDPIK